MASRRVPLRALYSLSLPFGLIGAVACSDTYKTYVYAAAPDGGGGEAPDGGESPDGGPDASDLPEGAPRPDTARGEQHVDVFGEGKNEYFFVVDDAEVVRINERNPFAGGGGPIGPGGNQFGDLYTPGTGTGASDATYASHLLVTTPDPETTADYGKIQVRSVGQSTGRPWNESTLPSLRVDMDEFTEKERIGGREHLRFNNNVIGNVFREYTTLSLFRKLGYPAPLTSYAWVGSTVWGPGVRVPYTVVEVYKRTFCERYADEWGGGCANMWEFFGDLLQGQAADPANCQVDSCDDSRMTEFEGALAAAPFGEGFKAALASYVDWPAYHRFQCLSWIFDLNDDPIHAQNNVVIVERKDGLFQYLPYSTDMSLGYSGGVPLTGMNMLSNGCQQDPGCWADTIAVCEQTIQDFTAADPVGFVDGVFADLAGAEMLRTGDAERYKELRSWMQARIDQLPGELEMYRDPHASGGDCYPLEWCNGACVLPGECFGGCGGKPGPFPQPVPEPVPVDPGGAADAGAAGVGGAAGAAGDIALPPGVGVPPPGCVPIADVYGAK